MNDRLGRFGRRELTALTAICTLIFGCFSTEESGIFDTGNRLHFATLIALFVSVTVLRLAANALERAGADSLGGRLALFPKPVCGAACVFGVSALLLGATLPGMRFIRAMTDFIYVEAEPARIALYCVPCLAALSMLGMETLTRTARVLLPLTLAAAAFGLGSDVPLYRFYRLYPLLSDGMRLVQQSAVSLLRFLPVVLLLLSCARGAQGWRNVRRAGTVGMLLGGALTVVAELCLGMSYRYTELRELSAPLYRLMLEIDTDNASVRLDRVVLFVWTMAALFASACAVYGAALLTVECFSLRDVRPFAMLFAAAVVTAALVLREADDLGRKLPYLRPAGCAAALIPLAALLMRRRNSCKRE